MKGGIEELKNDINSEASAELQELKTIEITLAKNKITTEDIYKAYNSALDNFDKLSLDKQDETRVIPVEFKYGNKSLKTYITAVPGHSLKDNLELIILSVKQSKNNNNRDYKLEEDINLSNIKFFTPDEIVKGKQNGIEIEKDLLDKFISPDQYKNRVERAQIIQSINNIKDEVEIEAGADKVRNSTRQKAGAFLSKLTGVRRVQSEAEGTMVNKSAQQEEGSPLQKTSQEPLVEIKSDIVINLADEIIRLGEIKTAVNKVADLIRKGEGNQSGKFKLEFKTLNGKKYHAEFEVGNLEGIQNYFKDNPNESRLPEDIFSEIMLQSKFRTQEPLGIDIEKSVENYFIVVKQAEESISVQQEQGEAISSPNGEQSLGSITPPTLSPQTQLNAESNKLDQPEQSLKISVNVADDLIQETNIIEAIRSSLSHIQHRENVNKLSINFTTPNGKKNFLVELEPPQGKKIKEFLAEVGAREENFLDQIKFRPIQGKIVEDFKVPEKLAAYFSDISPQSIVPASKIGMQSTQAAMNIDSLTQQRKADRVSSIVVNNQDSANTVREILAADNIIGGQNIRDALWSATGKENVNIRFITSDRNKSFLVEVKSSNEKSIKELLKSVNDEANLLFDGGFLNNFKFQPLSELPKEIILGEDIKNLFPSEVKQQMEETKELTVKKIVVEEASSKLKAEEKVAAKNEAVNNTANIISSEINIDIPIDSQNVIGINDVKGAIESAAKQVANNDGEIKINFTSYTGELATQLMSNNKQSINELLKEVKSTPQLLENNEFLKNFKFKVPEQTTVGFEFSKEVESLFPDIKHQQQSTSTKPQEKPEGSETTLSLFSRIKSYISENPIKAAAIGVAATVVGVGALAATVATGGLFAVGAGLAGTAIGAGAYGIVKYNQHKENVDIKASKPIEAKGGDNMSESNEAKVPEKEKAQSAEVPTHQWVNANKQNLKGSTLHIPEKAENHVKLAESKDGSFIRR
ncbi:hypothetical protein H1Q59_04425 [Holosporaceae bacterium 'Namur']|nr:hypothetical protein [Holosporaceae bacterium 'Namur']